MPAHSYKDLIVWQKSVALAVMIYNLVEQFPKEEIYGLASQMKRSAISIPSNIAEGRYRGTRNDYARFLRISFASGAELETQIEIAKRLPKTNHLHYEKIDALLEEIMKMLNSMTRKIGSKS